MRIEGADFVGNGTHALVIPFAAVSRTAADNQFRLFFQCDALHFVVINTTGLFVQEIRNGLVNQTRSVH